MGGGEFLARIYSAVGSSEPLAVDQMGARELGPDAGSIQVGDRLAIRVFGFVAFVEQGAAPGLDAVGPVRAACVCFASQPTVGLLGQVVMP